MTKKGRHFFQEKIGVTPSVTASGDTDPSDANARCKALAMLLLTENRRQSTLWSEDAHLLSFLQTSNHPTA